MSLLTNQTQYPKSSLCKVKFKLAAIGGVFLILLINSCGRNGVTPNGDTLSPTATIIMTRTATATPTTTATATITPTPTSSATPTPVPVSLSQKFLSLVWVAYAPTHHNPDPAANMTASEEVIREDLQILLDAGFRGIVTYSSSGILAEVPRIAVEMGFEGIIMGIWSPGDAEETGAALQAVNYIDGYVVGNEGLFFDRYNLETLELAIAELKAKTRKPVTTTEVLSLYFHEPKVLELGDWLFPNVHPYWQGITDPYEAATWTEDTFTELEARSGGKPVILKEVGLPSEGAPRLSQYQQALYYTKLRDSSVRFVYFEAFDQFWKSEDGVGPFWGLFTKDQAPKVISPYIIIGYPPFYVYADEGSPDNHFAPEGWMGCWQGIRINENDQSDPHLGSSAIRITYQPQAGCADAYAGIYWWNPPGSEWCDDPGGFDLTGWTKLTFWAKGAQGGEMVEFKVGGLKKTNGDSCDSLQPARTTYPFSLTDEWKQYTISLYGRDISHLAGGFVWVTDSKEDITFFLDEIRIEWDESR